MLDKQTTLESATSPWHAGEVKLQQHSGVADQLDVVGRKFVRHFLLDQHREFYPLLPFIAVGAVDDEGTPWATIRSGQPGFLHSPDPQTLTITAASDPGDPAQQGMKHGDAVGLLGIDLITRRRNRMNGTVDRNSDNVFSVDVEHSFGNCPRYIQNRHFSFVRDPQEVRASASTVDEYLGEDARRIISTADTFFVASYMEDAEGRHVDVSHRGGRPGFVRIDADGGLTIPDFNGNLFFNTLGNFLINPRAGLLFFDQANGDLLQVAGSVEIILDSPEIAAFEGAERLWRVIPKKVVLRRDALPLRWTFAENWMSPSSVMTGSWSDAEARLQAAAKADAWRAFRIERIVDESRTIRSLHLAPVDAKGLIPHLAGQHLPIRIADGGGYINRTYTISSAPSDGYYRLSVKREGRASTLLHGMQPGDEISARAPAGAFTINAMERNRQAVLLAAGIGITPLLSMLRHVVHEGDRTRHRRPVWLFRASRTGEERAFDHEIRQLIERSQGTIRDIRVLGQSPSDGATDYEAIGRIDMDLVKSHLPFGDYDFYLCGPAAFMQSMYDGLRNLNVADDRIHAEAFGPSGLRRDGASSTAAVQSVPAASEPVRVIFTQSAKEARWKPGNGPLLDLAEQRGLEPAFGCRAGHCGECRAAVTRGQVSYLSEPTYPIGEGEALICCCVPAAGSDLHLAI